MGIDDGGWVVAGGGGIGGALHVDDVRAARVKGDSPPIIVPVVELVAFYVPGNRCPDIHAARGCIVVGAVCGLVHLDVLIAGSVGCVRGISSLAHFHEVFAGRFRSIGEHPRVRCMRGGSHAGRGA